MICQRIYSIYPNHLRAGPGSQEEIAKFNRRFKKELPEHVGHYSNARDEIEQWRFSLRAAVGHGKVTGHTHCCVQACCRLMSGEPYRLG